LIVEYNMIDGVTGYSTGDGHGIILDHYPRGYGCGSGYDYICDGVIIRYNFVKDCTSDAHPSGIKVWNGRNCEIYGNVIVGCERGFSCSTSCSTGNVFYNNTVVGSSVHGVELNSGFPASIWKNSIIDGGTCAFFVNKTTYPTESYTLHHNNSWTNGAQVRDATSINDNPYFKNSTNDDFTLTSSSPCINTGTNCGDDYSLGLSPNTDWSTTPTTVDIINQRDYGSGWEIGAWVYTGDSPLPLAPPKGVSFVR